MQFKNIIIIFILFKFYNCVNDDKPTFDYENENTNDKYAECSIFNQESKLLNKNYMMAMQRGERSKAYTKPRHVLLPPSALPFTDPKQAVWLFVPVENFKNTFYLRNLKFNEDLFASTNYLGFTTKRRLVLTWADISKKMTIEPKAFMWTFRRTENDPNKYTIWNVGYDEQMCAGTYLYAGDVYTWPKDEKNENKNQFVWSIKCKSKLPF